MGRRANLRRRFSRSYYILRNILAGNLSGGDTSSSTWDVHQDRDDVDLAGTGDDRKYIDVGISNAYRGRGSILASSRSSEKNTPTDKKEGTNHGRDCRARPVRKDGGWRYERARKEPPLISGGVVTHDTHKDRPARSPSRGQPYGDRRKWPQDAYRIDYSKGGEYGDIRESQDRVIRVGYEDRCVKNLKADARERGKGTATSGEWSCDEPPERRGVFYDSPDHREYDRWGLGRACRKRPGDDGYTASYTSGENTTESVPRPAGQYRGLRPSTISLQHYCGI